MSTPGRQRSILIRVLVVGVLIALAAATAAATQLTGGSSGDAAGRPAGAMHSKNAGPTPARAAARRLHRYVAPSGDDRADGSRARPWRTVAHAARRVRPGMTVHVAPGRYAGRVTIRRGGTRGRPVRFVSDERWEARIEASGRGAVTMVSILGDQVRFEGFDVTGSGGDGSGGIEALGSHTSIVANRVRDLAMPCLGQGNGGAGIVIGSAQVDYRTRDVLVERNVISDIGSGPRDGSCRLVHGIYAETPRATIVNNVIDGAAGDGITSWHGARELAIVNNLSTANGGNGLLIGSGDSGATRLGHTGTAVVNNIITRNALYSISESSDGDHRVGRNRYESNMTFGNRLDDSAPLRDRLSEPQIAGNLTADPQLPPDAGLSSVEIPASSPAVDAGTCAGAPSTDIAGVRRPQGAGIDIGPFERPATRGRC
jgi:hypothetical protein